MRIQSIGDYYTLQGAAEALGVSYWQVWRAVRQQQTPTLLLGQTRLVLLEDVQALLPERASDQPEREPPRPAVAAGQQTARPAVAAVAQEPQRAASAVVAGYRVMGHRCPQCEANALVYEEGCQKCYACGYAAC